MACFTGATVARARRWTFAEMATVELGAATQTDRQLAVRIGRTPKAVKQWRYRNHIAATRTTARWITSGEAARLLGCSQQWVTTLARRKAIPSRRVPGGRWWLIDWNACQN